jgi:hypothetical protein
VYRKKENQMDSYHTIPNTNAKGTLLCLGKSIRATFIDPDEAALAAEALNAVIDAPIALVPVEDLQPAYRMED